MEAASQSSQPASQAAKQPSSQAGPFGGPLICSSALSSHWSVAAELHFARSTLRVRSPPIAIAIVTPLHPLHHHPATATTVHKQYSGTILLDRPPQTSSISLLGPSSLLRCTALPSSALHQSAQHPSSRPAPTHSISRESPLRLPHHPRTTNTLCVFELAASQHLSRAATASSVRVRPPSPYPLAPPSSKR